MNGPQNPNQLIVEGYDDLFSVVGLMSAHVEWPKDKAFAPVHINIGGGASEILKKAGMLNGLVKGPQPRVGLVLDADSKSNARWDAVRKICDAAFPQLPQVMPANGLVIDNEDNKRLGVWIMPDNSSEGALETFLKYLIPNHPNAVWEHARHVVETARLLGCPYRDVHAEKARLYTWLAWQDPPSQSPGEALTRKILDPHSESASTFVAWFRKLYDMPLKTAKAD